MEILNPVKEIRHVIRDVCPVCGDEVWQDYKHDILKYKRKPGKCPSCSARPYRKRTDEFWVYVILTSGTMHLLNQTEILLFMNGKDIPTERGGRLTKAMTTPPF